ncbi:bifunctional hydroxymethylpyrimidine kinase/phosphomethylpyrimidine kinase [Arthrobacter sp. GMC3]|uniref:bifunctional hydroxymethylpyrimidine kinase/phosphomethylpyrimidine kinase n=1 Tax=Arthrobacter sp. GMC3 TaxID=2058894 RepID=UPI000CE37A2A|nr:bifunctional hydroxymethylpyrimidine kinase/phosphomethylpyrimidine kinase [Arthrobacter sp. GMC3]
MRSETLALPTLIPSLARPTHPRILSIAGSDPSGGAGIQADIKAISAHGGYAMTAVTALTAQNTQGVHDVHVPPAAFLTRQLEALNEDIAIDGVKIGMLANAAVIKAVGDWLAKTRPAVVVLDPVMVATSGDALMDDDGRLALLGLLEHAHLVTPNLPELAVLVGEPEVESWEAALRQGKKLAVERNVRVLVKGGHLVSDVCPDALISPDGSLVEFAGERIETANTHGTGCSLSAAVATLQAQTGDWVESVGRAKTWLTQALNTSDLLAVGQGRGPLNHFHALWATAAPEADVFSRGLWDDIAGHRAAIFELDFIKELLAGTLPQEHFVYYLAQDAHYLGAYSRVLAHASALAPTEDEQRFWAKGAQNCLAVELELHKEWLDTHPSQGDMGPVTKHYVDHLAAAAFGGSYGEVVAAVLPCYWLYAEVGKELHSQYLAGEVAGSGPAQAHPYGRWLATYADDEFAEATRTAVGIADAAARRGSAQERQRMRTAFIHSAQYEVDFFDAPRLHVRNTGELTQQ